MVRGKLTFISGGVRSGKSAYAEELLVTEAQKSGGRLVYIASGTATDSEMQKRIEKHRVDRAGYNWVTIEQPMQLEEVLPFIQQGDLVLWDCLTTWLANEMYEGWEQGLPCIARPGCIERKEERMYQTVDAMLSEVTQLVVVSNEVLDDVPPTDPETQTYREWLGRIHRKLVLRADVAIEMEYGMAMVWKGEGAR